MADRERARIAESRRDLRGVSLGSDRGEPRRLRRGHRPHDGPVELQAARHLGRPPRAASVSGAYNAAAAEKPGPVRTSPTAQKAVAKSAAGSTPNQLKEDLPGFSPKLDRDPTLSPPDIVRLQTPAKTVVKAAKGPGPIENRIELSG